MRHTWCQLPQRHGAVSTSCNQVQVGGSKGFHRLWNALMTLYVCVCAREAERVLGRCLKTCAALATNLQLANQSKGACVIHLDD